MHSGADCSDETDCSDLFVRRSATLAKTAGNLPLIWPAKFDSSTLCPRFSVHTDHGDRREPGAGAFVVEELGLRRWRS